MEQTGIFESNSKILNEIERLKNEQSSLRQVVDCLYLETRKPVSISKKGQEVPNKLFKSDEEEYREPVYSKCESSELSNHDYPRVVHPNYIESIIKEKTGEFDEFIKQYDEDGSEIVEHLIKLKNKKADKTEVNELKERVYALESQVKELLKTNKDLLQSKELQSTQVQNTLEVPQGGTDLTLSQIEKPKKPELKIPPEKSIGVKTPLSTHPLSTQSFEGLKFSDYANSEYANVTQISCNSIDLKISQTNTAVNRAQQSTLKMLAKLYSISLGSSSIDKKNNDLVTLHENICNSLNGEVDKLIEDTFIKKLINGIISQATIKVFFKILLAPNEPDSLSLMNDIKFKTTSRKLLELVRTELKTAIRKGDERSILKEYSELANDNFGLFKEYEKSLADNGTSYIVSPKRSLIVIKSEDKDKIKEIIRGGKMAVTSPFTTGLCK